MRTSTKEVDRGHDGSGVYRGGKYQIYEGGTRVPFIIRWPGKIKPGRSDALVSQIDLVASFAELVGVKLGADECVDSRNTLDAFLGKDARGLPFMIEEAGVLAVRVGDWKYIPGRVTKRRNRKTKKIVERVIKGQLYDLANDVGEKHNLVDQYPKRCEEMGKLLAGIRKAKGIRGH